MKRILGLDVGERRTGIAVSDPFGWTAQGVEVWRTVSREKDMDRIVHWAHEYDVAAVVIGLPLNMDGTKGPRAQWMEEFARELGERLPERDIILQDERLSTVQAQRSLIAGDMRREKRRTVVDKIAAVVILQRYLDARQG